MHFNQVIDSITEEISTGSKYTKEDIKKVLMKVKDANKPDFCIYMNQLSNNPVEDAKALFDHCTAKKIEIIKDLQHKDNFISFNLNKQLFFKDILLTIQKEKNNFGKTKTGENKTYVVDYSSPNIAKIFHVGHFRTTILGNFVVKLLNNCGYKTVSLNYLGDWGKQFGLVLYGYELYGDEKKLIENPLIHLFNIYVQISKEAKENPKVDEEAKRIFKEMEENKNEKYLKVWRRFREISIEKYKELYSKLNVKFDVYSGESFYNDGCVELLKNIKIAHRDDDGSLYINCKNHGNALIQKSDGATLYMTRDIVAVADRLNTFKADKLIYVVADEQDKHFHQLFCIMEQLGYSKDKFLHINYGLIKGMSTRDGKVHFLEDIIDTTVDIIKKNLLNDEKKDLEIVDKDQTALVLAISTLIVADFSAKRIKGYTYNVEERTSCEKGNGAYLQYAHCRLRSIEEKNSEVVLDDLSDVNFDCINNPEVCDLAYKLLWYEYAIELCLEDFEPSRIVLYLMDLCKTINYLVLKLRVKNEPEDIAKARMLVLSSCRIVLNNALQILGITPLERM